MNKTFVLLNLNIYGIKTDIISNIDPPRELNNGISFPCGINCFKIECNVEMRANNNVKYIFFPIIPNIIGEFDIFYKNKINNCFKLIY